MLQPIHGRGRGRGRLPTGSYNSSPSLVSPITSELSLSPNSSPKDDNQSESGFSSASSDIQLSTSAQTKISTGRGRGAHLKRNLVSEDPHWTVTNLTKIQFNSNIQPTEPNELGTL